MESVIDLSPDEATLQQAKQEITKRIDARMSKTALSQPVWTAENEGLQIHFFEQESKLAIDRCDTLIKVCQVLGEEKLARQKRLRNAYIINMQKALAAADTMKMKEWVARQADLTEEERKEVVADISRSYEFYVKRLSDLAFLSVWSSEEARFSYPLSNFVLGKSSPVAKSEK